MSTGIAVIIPYKHVNKDTFVKSGVHYGELFFHAPIWLWEMKGKIAIIYQYVSGLIKLYSLQAYC